MPEYKAPLDDMRFVVHDVFNLSSFCSDFPALSDVDKDTADAILEEAAKVSEQLLSPLDQVGDEEGCSWHDGRVQVPSGFADAYKRFSEDGWGALGGDANYGGMGMPKTLVSLVEEMVQGANMAFGLAPMLTAGACLSIYAHGSEELKTRYLPKLYSGEWSGAMDLTEAHAGTDLGLMRAKATPNDDGSYNISGTKIFITWGEHDMADNIIHLVLAKLPDAPAGSKGISLFLVPKILPNSEGELTDRNPVNCGSIEHKMGIHGSPTCVMNFDGAKGWLVGEVHKGLLCMFTMMNYERLVVGIQGVGAADKAYQCARDYALDRVQGRSPSPEEVSSGSMADPIIVHMDVRRMLLEAKALNEAGRAFYVYVATWLDRAKYATDPALIKQAEGRVALLTPVVKAFLTDRALDACVQSQQVLGGHGYIREWGQEQRVRDVRITQIYEGTNGVQAMDLIGRKTIHCKGELLSDYIEEMRACLLSGASAVDSERQSQFSELLDRLEQLTAELVSEPEAELGGAVATDYLDLLGYCSYAYMWILELSALDQNHGLASQFRDSKFKTAGFFFEKLLPNVESLIKRIEAGHDSLSAFDPTEF